jgi:hypothetical protein
MEEIVAKEIRKSEGCTVYSVGSYEVGIWPMYTQPVTIVKTVGHNRCCHTFTTGEARAICRVDFEECW